MSEASDVGPKDGRLDELLISHLDSAYNLARWLMRNSHDAEDVIQEAQLRNNFASDRVLITESASDFVRSR
jgi:DNA-directed RNA polymerase specialized sigma24 family protein